MFTLLALHLFEVISVSWRVLGQFTPPVQACRLNLNKCKRPAYNNYLISKEISADFSHSTPRPIRLNYYCRQRDADNGLGSSGTL